MKKKILQGFSNFIKNLNWKKNANLSKNHEKTRILSQNCKKKLQNFVNKSQIRQILSKAHRKKGKFHQNIMGEKCEFDLKIVNFA